MQLTQPKNQYYWLFVFYICCFLEYQLHCFWINVLGVFWSPIAILAVSITMIFAAHKLFEQPTRRIAVKLTSTRLHPLFYGLIYIIIAVACFLIYKGHVDQIPIDKDISDVIPAMELYNKRLLAGEEVYAPMDFGSWTVIPNYLPMVWLPYSIAEFIGFDYRYLSFLFFIGVHLLFLVRFHSFKRQPFLINIVNLALPFIFTFGFLKKEDYVFGTTLEIGIAAIYLFLIYALYTKRVFLLILAISFCLFSRFSFVYWLPFLGIYLLCNYSIKQVCIISFGVLSFGILVYVLPFLLKNPDIFTNGVAYYMKAGVGEWIVKDFQAEGAIPFHLGRGLGFSVFIHSFYDSDIPGKIAFNRNTQMAICIGITLLMTLYAWVKKKGKLHPFIVLLSLKMYFIFFYSTIHVPYIYLQVTHLSLTLAIVYMIHKRWYQSEKR